MQDISRQKKNKVKEEGFENLVGFFDLLLQIDMRVNPELYKVKNKKDD